MSQLQPMTRRDVAVKCIPVKSCLNSKHVPYVCKMRAAYLHYPPSDSNLYVNNLRMECIKLTATHLRRVASPTKIVGHAHSKSASDDGKQQPVLVDGEEGRVLTVGLVRGRERAALSWTVAKLIIHFSAESFVHFNLIKNAQGSRYHCNNNVHRAVTMCIAVIPAVRDTRATTTGANALMM